ncbi:TetR/AcrR family transcriptional regulator [Vibrio cholerae]|uniref:TetR/AcrR family transcriptional regulator n=1 Tax=Vibrio cholerae TaxID=666 RepID=UPI0004E35A06|nr:TetR/AcrR family transcriptional regulator [Vibrio cholerae]EJL6341798.1 TetR/AcrR family transcriptional regulator [Vibrio cholerae]EKF9471912.1 TetR/AcrR family transcriptional regulator [Vibrio cholerae]EKF9725020.1 TetR/AcrR family transcriptional regulator [Vibrio cholerae]KFE26863.1 bacterial regulatory s, tetR family protein [Vibrio cholerae]TXY42925.1 TetR/AcrR family transcriptional regulator [Vibrio cholerae]
MIEKKQGRRSAQDAQKTRYHIITIAAELFCELGYSRVSLRHISEKAGVSHSLIRHHFGSKEKIWHSISDGLHDYMIRYMQTVLQAMPADTPVNVKLYTFLMRMLAHGLIIKQPIQLIADAVRQEDKLFDYFLDTSGEIERLVESLADDYNRQYPQSPIHLWEIKWQLIMYTHSAASLTPFMRATWAPEIEDVSACLLKHWQLFNALMIEKFHVAKPYIMQPNSVDELVYTLSCDWRDVYKETEE